jgi:hypothetical protein
MLKTFGNQDTDLISEKQKAIKLLPAELQKYKCYDDDITKINYPVTDPLQNIKSLSFDKTPDIKAILKGIKGQYLIFKNDTVLNIRKHNGYYLIFTY